MFSSFQIWPCPRLMIHPGELNQQPPTFAYVNDTLQQKMHQQWLRENIYLCNDNEDNKTRAARNTPTAPVSGKSRRKKMQRKRNRAKQNGVDGSDDERGGNTDGVAENALEVEDENFLLQVLIDGRESDVAIEKATADNSADDNDDDDDDDAAAAVLERIIADIAVWIDDVDDEIEEPIVDLHGVYDGSIWWSRE